MRYRPAIEGRFCVKMASLLHVAVARVAGLSWRSYFQHGFLTWVAGDTAVG
jgi:hypothetical protein